jgi:hypothetical protein
MDSPPAQDRADDVFEYSVGSVSDADHRQRGKKGHSYEDPILGSRGIDETRIIDQNDGDHHIRYSSVLVMYHACLDLLHR